MREPDYTKIGGQIGNRFREGLPDELARDYSPRESTFRNIEDRRRESRNLPRLRGFLYSSPAEAAQPRQVALLSPRSKL